MSLIKNCIIDLICGELVIDVEIVSLQIENNFECFGNLLQNA